VQSLTFLHKPIPDKSMPSQMAHSVPLLLPDEAPVISLCTKGLLHAPTNSTLRHPPPEPGRLTEPPRFWPGLYILCHLSHWDLCTQCDACGPTAQLSVKTLNRPGSGVPLWAGLGFSFPTHKAPQTHHASHLRVIMRVTFLLSAICLRGN
jgi:hypothetical protein